MRLAHPLKARWYVMDVRPLFARNLKRLRVERDLSQIDIAYRKEVVPSYRNEAEAQADGRWRRSSAGRHGEADLAVVAMPLIVEEHRVELVEPVPSELQNYTVFTAGIGSAAEEAEAAIEAATPALSDLPVIAISASAAARIPPYGSTIEGLQVTQRRLMSALNCTPVSDTGRRHFRAVSIAANASGTKRIKRAVFYHRPASKRGGVGEAILRQN
jgi:hypothetical protein